MSGSTSESRPLWRAVELRVLVGLLIVVLGTWLFIVLAAAVNHGGTHELDVRVVRGLRAADDESRIIGPVWLAEVARDLTALGGYTVLFLVTTTVAVFLGLIGNHVALRFVLFSICSGWLLSMWLKALFERPRPDVVEHLSQSFTSSFPSGHSMMAAVVYLTLGALLARFSPTLKLRMFFLIVAILLTLLVGCSRVLMGVHYPTDVLAGWSAGLVWATFCWLVTRRWQKRHPAAASPDGGTPAVGTPAER